MIGDLGEFGGVSGKIGLGILLIFLQFVGVGNLIFKGFIGSFIVGLVFVGVFGRIVGIEGKVVIEVKFIGLIFQLLLNGKFDLLKG